VPTVRGERVNYLKWVKLRNWRQRIKERLGELMWKTKTIYRVVVLRCACSVKYYNMVASKIGFGCAFTIISEELSVGGKYELVFPVLYISHLSVGKSIIKYIGGLTYCQHCIIALETCDSNRSCCDIFGKLQIVMVTSCKLDRVFCELESRCR